MADNSTFIEKKNDKYTVNQKDLNIIDQSINSTVINKIIDYSSSCSSAINNSQEITMQKIQAEGDIVVDNTQKQMIVLDFKCVDKIKIIDESIEDILSKLMDKFHKMNRSVVDEIEQKAKDIIIAQNLATKPDKTETNINIKTVISDILNVNITNKVINECFIKMGNYQNVLIKNIRGETVNAVIEQEQAVHVMGKCINSLNIGQKIIDNIIDKFNIVVENQELKIPSDITLPPSIDDTNDWNEPSIPQTSPISQAVGGNQNLFYILIGVVGCCFFIFLMSLILVSKSD